MKMQNDDIKALLGILLIPLVIILNAYVATRLWLWHVVPTFHVTPLRVRHVIGFGALHVAWSGYSGRNDTESGFDMSLRCIFTTLFAWGLGWLAS